MTAAADALTQRLPQLEAARFLYGRQDTEADDQYQIVVLLLELARRLSELESRERERDGGK